MRFQMQTTVSDIMQPQVLLKANYSTSSVYELTGIKPNSFVCKTCKSECRISFYIWFIELFHVMFKCNLRSYFAFTQILNVD